MEKRFNETDVDITEIGEVIFKIKAACDNIFCLRIGIINEDLGIDSKVIDRTLWSIEDRIRDLTDRIEELLSFHK